MSNKKIKILQIGEKSWSSELNNDAQSALDWTFFDIKCSNHEAVESLIKGIPRPFDAVICTDYFDNGLVLQLFELIEVYGLVVDLNLKTNVNQEIQKIKIPFFLDFEDKSQVIEAIKSNFFSGQMGSKLHVNTIRVTPLFSGRRVISGESHLLLEGKFPTRKRTTLLTWQQNIGMYGRSKKLWLEFECDPSVSFSLILLKIKSGGSTVVDRLTYSQEELKSGIEVPYEKDLGYLSVSLMAEGVGKLKIGPLHFRDSRQDYGEYILGGKKISDSSNQELFYYFHPGDMKPPLNVYFSGYRSAEGFEGFFMMKSLGAPFLLIADPRLEGGSFYMGSDELEQGIFQIISSHLMALNFSRGDLILSGLSMGTFGALYYASQLNPGYVIVGKPLVNVGDIAKNERIIRPGGFPTSLDILQSLTGSLSEQAVDELNQRFWKKFEQGNFEETQFVIAYMIHDDYDVNAYAHLVHCLSHKNSSLISKGIAGRHNDNSQGINTWFINQYKRILFERFERTKRVRL